MKEDCHPTAVATFEGTNINVTSSGRPYLRAALGMASYTDHFVAEKIAQWAGEVSLLSAIAITQLHAAYAAFPHGPSSRWSYFSRILPYLSSHFQHLENVIRTEFIPTLTRNPSPSDLVVTFLPYLPDSEA